MNMEIKMTGKEAKEILDEIIDAIEYFDNGSDKWAFYRLGILTNKLENIIAIDKISFNPTVKE